MKFEEIKENSKVFPGEYLLHQPTQQIVMCGAFKKREGTIKALAQEKLIEDRIEHFRKIYLSKKEREQKRARACGGCKKR